MFRIPNLYLILEADKNRLCSIPTRPPTATRTTQLTQQYLPQPMLIVHCTNIVSTGLLERLFSTLMAWLKRLLLPMCPTKRAVSSSTSGLMVTLVLPLGPRRRTRFSRSGVLLCTTIPLPASGVASVCGFYRGHLSNHLINIEPTRGGFST